MPDISYKKFSELAATTSLIAADVIPVVTTTGGNNSKQITYGSFAQTVSSTLIGPFTTTITAVEPASAGKWNSTYTTVNANSASWGTGGSTSGFTIFKQISSVASPNNSTTVHALSIISSQTNVDIAVPAKGIGATLAQIPDDTTSGGSKRGIYATDWQKVRVVNTQVASGIESTIGGGGNNAAAGNYSIIGGGLSNTASGSIASVGGGSGNTASGMNSTICGGNNNTALSSYSTVGGGDSNISRGLYSTVVGGYSNTASGANSTVGGHTNTASGLYATAFGGGNSASGEGSVTAGVSNAASGYSTIAIGSGNAVSGVYAISIGNNNTASGEGSVVIGTNGKSIIPGQFVYSDGSVNNVGDRQISTFLLRQTTTSAVSTACVINNGTSEITMAANESMFVTATVTCLSSYGDGTSYFGTIRGVAKCNGAGAVSVYNVTAQNVLKFPTTTALNSTLSASGNKLRVVVFAPGTQTFNWNVKLEAISING